MSAGATVGPVVIVGGGVAGVSTAAALRAGGYLGDVVLIDRAELPYDRPPLSKDYLAGARDLKAIALHPAEWYDEQRIELVGPATVTGITPGADSVEVATEDGRSWNAAHVVLALGGAAIVPPIPGLDDVTDAGRLHVLRDVEDGDRLREVLVPGARLLVVGAGLIGAEVASTASALGCEVTIVDPLDPPLAAAGDDVARWLHDEHRHRGIDVRSTVVESARVTPTGVEVQLAGLDDIEVDFVLLGVGMRPRTELAQAAGLDLERGVLVDEGQVTSHPRVLAVGDVAQRRGAHPAEHWEAALHDGQRAAATTLGIPAPDPTASWWWSDRHDAHVEGVGSMRPADVDVQVVIRGTVGEPPFSAFALDGDRVVGAVAVDDSQAVRAARRLIDRGIAVDAARLADTSTDLRKLLRG